MEAAYADGQYTITVTADEGHVLLWGGPVELAAQLGDRLHTVLAEQEDAMPEAEYAERFGDLQALYERLRRYVQTWEGKS